MDTQSTKLLLTGQPQGLRQWLDEYAHWLWSWLYVQTGGQPEKSGEALFRTFADAIEHIVEFSASGLSMSEWLRTIARRALNQADVSVRLVPEQDAEGQMVRNALANLATEPLPRELFPVGQLNRLVAAALLDLEKEEMELLVSRYSAMDTLGHIAARAGTTSEQLAARLYRARHSFSAALQNIAGVGGRDEPAATGMRGVEILEGNLERLLCSVSPVSPVPQDIYNRLEEIVEKSSEYLRKTRQKRLADRRMILKIVCISAFLALPVAMWFLWPAGKEGGKRQEESRSRTAVVKNKQESPETKAGKILVDESDGSAKELKQAFEMGEAGDVKGLINMLRTGSLAGQLVAARYLAEYGDRSAIDALEQAAAQWRGEHAGENPFNKAIEAIENRLEQPAPVERSIQAADQAVPAVKKKEETGIVLKGRVLDTNSKRMAGVKIELSGWSQNQERKNISKAFQTDQQGDFQVRIESGGFVRLELKDRPADASVLARSFFCQADVPEVKADFGIGLSACGSVIVNGEPLVDAELLAAEVCGTESSGFLARCRTDQAGGFRFVGLLPGHYAVFYVRKWAGQDVSIVLGELLFDRDVQLGIVTADAALDIFSDGEKFAPPSGEGIKLRVPSWFRGHAVSTAKTEPNEPYWFEDVPAGRYEAEIPIGGGVYWYEPIEISRETAVQHFQTELPAIRGVAEITGIRNTLGNFCLWSRDRKVRGLPEPQGKEGYQSVLPPGLYYAGLLLSGRPVPLADFQIIEGEKTTVDLSARQAEYAQRGAMDVYVTDTGGSLLSGVSLELQGREFLDAQSAGQGVCFSAWAGPYVLSAGMEGFVSRREAVEITPFDTPPEGMSGRTKVIRLERR